MTCLTNLSAFSATNILPYEYSYVQTKISSKFKLWNELTFVLKFWKAKLIFTCLEERMQTALLLPVLDSHFIGFQGGPVRFCCSSPWFLRSRMWSSEMQLLWAPIWILVLVLYPLCLSTLLDFHSHHLWQPVILPLSCLGQSCCP